jgi:hypothetical protein
MNYHTDPKALAEKWFERALSALKSEGRDQDFHNASQMCVQALCLNPDLHEAWIMRGNILHRMEKPLDALLHYDRALSIREDLRDAWCNRGLAFADLGMWSAALDSFQRSLAVAPSTEPHIGMANMFCTLMRLAEAEREYRLALEFENSAEIRFNLGVTILGAGRWEEGFREYEHRWKNTPFPPRAYALLPKWQGESLNGKTILLYPEQGYGDEIMALRFALVLRQADRVIVQSRDPMLRLAGTLPLSYYHGDTVVPMHAELPEGVDYSCPLLDVPMVLGMTPDTVPTPHHYLRPPDCLKVEEWRKRLPKGLNVGLCWQSGGHLGTARAAQLQKSIPPHLLKAFAIPGVNLISLQKPRVEVPPELGLIDWMDECGSFAETANLVETLDLVISSDTAVAHLAGAMGKLVWNFVRFSGYWPWLAHDVAPDPAYSIWYPNNMRLYRQPALNNWGEPVARASANLQSLVASKMAA